MERKLTRNEIILGLIKRFDVRDVKFMKSGNEFALDDLDTKTLNSIYYKKDGKFRDKLFIKATDLRKNSNMGDTFILCIVNRNEVINNFKCFEYFVDTISNGYHDVFYKHQEYQKGIWSFNNNALVFEDDIWYLMDHISKYNDRKIL